MFRKLLFAGTVALSALAISPAAEAKTTFQLYFGVPFYSQQVAPGWRYYPGYGWYDHRRYGDVRRHFRGRLTCSQARRLVDRSGYNRVRTIECNGATYTFRAVNRRGHRVTVYVNSRSGSIWRR